jgi:hypothetical protein
VHRGSLDFVRDDGDDDDDGSDDDGDDVMTAGKLIRKDASIHTESCMIMIIWGRRRSGIACHGLQSDRVSFVVAGKGTSTHF